MNWINPTEQPPLDCRIECLVCTECGDLFMAEYHSDPEGWWTDSLRIDSKVIGYIYETDIPKPRPRPYITNDAFVFAVLKDKK